MKFRPCIDLHDGVVRQIVGSTLSDDHPENVEVNFTADRSPSWFAEMYRRDNLTGGHVIKLGSGNDHAAEEALGAWPGGLQIGGGITAENASGWLDKGASHVIVTSYVFRDGQVDFARLSQLVKAVGRERLVLDLSCRKRDEGYYIVTDRWQTFSREVISAELLETLALSCDEFLVHGVDVEGRCAGVETGLLKVLADWSPIGVTYAGGIRDLSDMRLIRDIGRNRIDATIGSGLDIFGGTTVSYEEVVAFCRDTGASG